jgi:hypothetical protein
VHGFWRVIFTTFALDLVIGPSLVYISVGLFGTICLLFLFDISSASFGIFAIVLTSFFD